MSGILNGERLMGRYKVDRPIPAIAGQCVSRGINILKEEFQFANIVYLKQ